MITQQTAHGDQEISACILFAVKVPSDLKRTQRAQIEGLRKQLLQPLDRHAADLIHETLDMKGRFGVTVFERGRATRDLFAVMPFRIAQQKAERLEGPQRRRVHIDLQGPDRKPKPVECLCSSGSALISMASSRCMGGITKRSSNVHSADSL